MRDPRQGQRCHWHILLCVLHLHGVWRGSWKRADLGSASHWWSLLWWCPGLCTALWAPRLHFGSKVIKMNRWATIFILSTGVLFYPQILNWMYVHISGNTSKRDSMCVLICLNFHVEIPTRRRLKLQFKVSCIPCPLNWITQFVTVCPYAIEEVLLSWISAQP